MKQFTAILLCLLLLLPGCGKTDRPSSGPDPENSQSSLVVKGEGEEEEETPSVSFTVESLPRESWESLTRDDFEYIGGAAHSPSVEWVDRENLLFYTYWGDWDPVIKGECRFFSYHIPSGELKPAGEYTTFEEVTIQMTSFRREDKYYLLFMQRRSQQNLYEIDLGTGGISITDGNSQLDLSGDGLLLIDQRGEPDAVVVDYFKEAEYWEGGDCLLKFRRDPLERFYSWSPDGQYLLFHRYNNLEEYYTDSTVYAVYDRNGEKVIDVDSVFTPVWCREPGFLVYSAAGEGGASRILLDLGTGDETVLPMEAGPAAPWSYFMIQEPRFSILWTREEGPPEGVYFLDHGTGELTPIEIEGYEDLDWLTAVYNEEASAVLLECSMGVGSGKWIDCYLIRIEQ